METTALLLAIEMAAQMGIVFFLKNLAVAAKCQMGIVSCAFYSDSRLLVRLLNQKGCRDGLQTADWRSYAELKGTAAAGGLVAPIFKRIEEFATEKLRSIVGSAPLMVVAQCRKVKEVGELMTGELATEAPVNGGRNYLPFSLMIGEDRKEPTNSKIATSFTICDSIRVRRDVCHLRSMSSFQSLPDVLLSYATKTEREEWDQFIGYGRRRGLRQS
ncbi:hypothetical protein FCM35_KLT06383 [Carex littledalei]|uniref:Uncharacterized protein n=1 Tax=Carex littledalei TaxID=544730 RepID=A0A833V7N9_9POAL|nr:hypothetical protein FCM35_KLT06383 [Carex littledalei]